jgi:hypothetical protein
MKKLLALLLLIAIPSIASADSMEKYIELLRSDLRTTKTQIYTEAMELPDAEMQAFWPIQREYEAERAKLGDERLQLIKDYADNYSSLTPEMSKKLVDRAFKQESQRLSLFKKYTDKISKKVSPVAGARFAQIESVMNALVDLQIRANLPIMPATSTPAEGGDKD